MIEVKVEEIDGENIVILRPGISGGAHMQLQSKDLLGMQQLSVEEIMLILDTAQSMKQLAFGP